MKKNKAYYESLIKSSPLFDIDKDRDPGAYAVEKSRLIENLYLYLLEIDQKNEPYALEIVNTATRCIEKFDKSLGDFLHYFNRSWKLESIHQFEEQNLDEQFRGLKLTDEQKRAVRNYLKYVNIRKASASGERLYQLIAEDMNVSVEKVKEYAQLSSLCVISEASKDDNEEETVDIWEKVSDGRSIEQEFVSSDSVDDLMGEIDEAFETLQERQKPIVSALLTARIWPVVYEWGISVEDRAFLDMKLIDAYSSAGTMPTQRQIAEMFEKKEASLSRTMGEFLKRLSELRH